MFGCKIRELWLKSKYVVALPSHSEIIVGESYNWGSDNFATLPTNLTATPYATIANGKLVAAAAAPTDGSVYFEIVDISKRFTEGTFDAGQKITCKCLRSVKASA